MEPFTLMIATLIFWIGSAKGDLRCYCNEASCISTAYMCKSPSGKCYSMIPYDGESSGSAHGCVESLPATDNAICEQGKDVIKTRTGSHEWPIIICCSDDMCNYSDNLDLKMYPVNSKTTGNSVYTGEKSGSERIPNNQGGRDAPDRKQYPVSESYSQRLLWFKAAVIAVPIAGGFILILLVLLAIRMLRNDSRHHRQLMQMRNNRGLTKAQLYVADHFYPGKCEKHGHHQHHWSTKDKKHNPLYKDTDVKKVDYNSQGYKKITNSPSDGGSCNSIIVWGKSESNDPPLTLV